MLNKNKIRLMTLLAIYDKKYGEADRKKGQYFKWDYIYFRNFLTRTGVFAGCLILSVFYVLKKILIDQADIMTIDYKFEGTKIGFFVIVALVVYTFIGTAVAKKEYKKSKVRMEAYFVMLDKLDAMNIAARGNEIPEGVGAVQYGEAEKFRNNGKAKFKEPVHSKEELDGDGMNGYDDDFDYDYEQDFQKKYKQIMDDDIEPDEKWFERQYEQNERFGRFEGQNRNKTAENMGRMESRDANSSAAKNKSIDALKKLKEVRRRDASDYGESDLLQTDSDNDF